MKKLIGTVCVLVFLFTSVPVFASTLRIDVELLNYWRYLKDGFTEELHVGATGYDVRGLQYFLKDEGFFDERANGVFGEATSYAVRAFQKENGLPESGYVDEYILEQLNTFMNQELCPPSSDNRAIGVRYTPVSPDKKLLDNYIPNKLIRIDGMVSSSRPICLEYNTGMALVEMIKDAEGKDVLIGVTSSFRRQEIQEWLLEYSIRRRGVSAYDLVALPGHSEHQLGTTVDLSGASINYAEEKWLEENAYRYGFVMSYPPNAKEITGYAHEPWHYRYVGKRLATLIKAFDVVPISLLSFPNIEKV